MSHFDRIGITPVACAGIGIPGASDELITEAGLYADRMSINLEMPTETGLKLLAPEKSHQDVIKPLGFVKNQIIQKNQALWKVFELTPQKLEQYCEVWENQNNFLEIIFIFIEV